MTVLSGALTALGQAPLSLWWLALPACAAMLWAIGQGQAGPSWRRAFGQGWLAGVGYIVATHFWIVEPFFVNPLRHGWIAPFAVIGMAGGIALIWGAASALAYTVAGNTVARRWALIPAMTLAEICRAYLFGGFPWAPLGSLWLETPVAQLAALTGVHGLTALTLLLIGAPLALWPHRRLVAGAGVAALLGAGVVWGWGQARLAEPPGMTGKTVRIVQPNAPQHQKWDPAYIGLFFNRALAATRAPAAVAPDLIIWPETSVPALLNGGDEVIAQVTQAAAGVPVIFGIQRRDGQMYHNSLVAAQQSGLQIYDKRHLVPFGEYVPFGNALLPLGIRNLASAQGYGYAKGRSDQPLLQISGLGKGLPLICYEGVFPQDLRSFSGRADWMVLITNDAWFGKLAMPYQHLDHARMRAIEYGLPLYRAANTGISAVVGPKGRVRAQLGLGQTGHVDAAMPAALPETVYARNGDWPVGFLAALVLGLFLFGNRQKGRSDTD